MADRKERRGEEMGETEMGKEEKEREREKRLEGEIWGRDLKEREK